MIQMSITRTKFPVSHPPLTCPWLVIVHGEKQSYPTQTFVDIAQDHYVVANIPEMLNTEICTCSHGWLVLFEFESNECFLLNPVSMEKIMLPKLPPAFAFSTCILSAPPTDPECIVIIFESTENPSVIFVRLGGESTVWTEQYLGESFMGAAMCGGRIYALALGGTLMTAKVVGSNLVVTQVGAEELPNNTIPETFHFSYQIVESNGELFGVVKYYKGITDRIRLIEVYKMEFSRLVWTKVESLGGNRAFFLSGTTCNFSCQTTEDSRGFKVKPNCIYFIQGNDRHLYVFDLENCSISFSTPCPVQSNWFTPIWVMPLRPAL